MTVICNIGDEFRDLLPHFISHYLKWGVTEFVIGVLNGAKNPSWDAIVNWDYRDATVIVTPSYSGTLSSSLDSEFMNANRPTTGWYIPADLDEFHTVQGFTTFDGVEKACERDGAHYVASTLMDRITLDGTIPQSISPDVSIFDQFPREVDITTSIVQGCKWKVCCAHHSEEVTAGHHDLINKQMGFITPGKTHHFRWFGDVIRKETRKQSERPLYASENQRAIDHLLQFGKFEIP